MPDIALYYPYTHIRYQGWLKAAALYLPKLALMAPPGYPRRMSNIAQTLSQELDFLVDVDPTPRSYDVASDFLRLINDHQAALRDRYAWPRELPQELYASVAADGPACTGQIFPGVDDRVEWIHLGKVPYDLTESFLETGLGVQSDDRMWLALHPRLGAVYLSALADRVARVNDMPAVTDQATSYGTLNGWSIETLAQVLLDEPMSISAPRSGEQVAALYAAIAIETVVPDHIEQLPIAKIIEARRRLAPQFDAFCFHLDSMNSQFAELAAIEDPAILRARLEVLVNRDLRRPTAELEKGLRQLGLEPARAVLGMTSMQLPAVATAAISGLGVPVVAAEAGAVAAQFLTASVHARHAAEERRGGAAGYLLGLRRELSPCGAMERLRRTFRRASA